MKRRSEKVKEGKKKEKAAQSQSATALTEGNHARTTCPVSYVSTDLLQEQVRSRGMSDGAEKCEMPCNVESVSYTGAERRTARVASPIKVANPAVETVRAPAPVDEVVCSMRSGNLCR